MTSNLPGFNAGMREQGYIEGKDYIIEIRSASGDLKHLPQLAQELIASKVDVLMSSGTPSAQALQKLTRDIPILIQTAGDPVGTGLAAALNRPGGNITGLTGMLNELTTKRLDLMRQMLPKMRRVAFLYHPDNAADLSNLKQFEADCAKLGLQPIRAPLNNREATPAVFDKIKRDKAQGLIVSNNGTYQDWRMTIVEHAAKIRLPAMYGRGAMVEVGGLISYENDSADLYRRAAAYAVKIFKGAKPADLPIEQPLKFEMALNMKTAKALGIKIPDSIGLRADRVIE